MCGGDITNCIAISLQLRRNIHPYKSCCLQKKIHLADINFRTIDQEGHAKGMRVGGLFHGKINGRGSPLGGSKLGKDGFA